MAERGTTPTGDELGTNLGIALLRLALGIVFVVHGVGKLLGIGPTATTIGDFSGFLDGLGVPVPMLAAVVVGLVETFGGLFVLVGLFTRYAAALLAGDILVATVLVHIPNGFSVANGGYEFTLTLFLVALAVTFLGADAFSLERRLFDRELTIPVTRS